MFRKVGILVAAVIAVAVVTVGMNTYACDRNAKASKASYGAGCCSGKMASASCTHSCAGMSAAQKASCAKACGSNAAWTSNVCGSKGYYAANVYAVQDGHEYAVYNGKTFEVTDATPYTQVGEARYYFADNACKISCTKQMADRAPEIEQETIALATADGNIVKVENGMKIARCPVTGREFAVTPNTETKVMDGKKYYFAALQTADAAH